MSVSRANTEPSYDDCPAPRQRGRMGAAHDHAGHAHADHAPAVHDHSGHSRGGHDHHGHAASRGLKGALVVTAIFLVAEVVGGLLSNSLTLLADAGHMLTDVGALAFSLFVAWLARQPSTPQKTYGYLRWEILAALLNGAMLLAISAAIVWEAIQRLRSPEPVQTGVMLGVGVAGLVVNAIAAKMLHGGSDHSLNVRGAYLHVLSDFLGSLAAVVAALFIRYRGWTIADPIASIVMTLLIVRSSWALVSESVDVLLEATPAHIDVTDVRRSLESIDGVESVHDLHVWTLTSGVVALSAHAVVHDPARNQGALEAMTASMATAGIHHVTIQIEGETLEECAPERVPGTAGVLQQNHG
ncbi:MAG: cation diffusion facilitator family transporter [Gemmatimonadales bacterium]